MQTIFARVFGPIVMAATLAAACADPAAPEQRQARGTGGQGAAVPVTVASVVQKPMPLEVQTIGTVEPYSTVAVQAQITGELTSVHFREGEDVRQGQVLFTLDRRPLEAALQQSQSNLERDQALAVNARAQASRYEDLARRGIVPREQVDQTLANAAALEATVAADRAAVEHAKVQLQYSTITARISGRTGALKVHAGNLMRANDSTPLVVINQVTPVYVSFGIPEAQLPDLRRYMAQRSVRIEARPPDDAGPAATGRITFVDNAVDQTTGTIRIKGIFPNEDRRLWPGQFVNLIVILTTDPRAIVIPTMAVQAGPQGHYVYVVKPDETVDLRPVTIARTNGAEMVIGEGLAAGETVVTDGQIRLLPGSRIRVRTETADKLAS